MVSLDTLIKRLRVFKVPKHVAVDLHKTLSLWVRKSGEEWTVSKLKQILVAYLQFQAGNTDLVRATFQGGWIRYDKQRLTPKGPFGYLWKLPLPQAVGAMRLYTMFVSKKVTKSQWKKFYEAVTATDRSDPSVFNMNGIIRFIKEGNSAPRKLGFADFLYFYGRGIRTVDRSGRSVNQTEEVFFDSFNHPLVLDFMGQNWRDLTDHQYRIYADSIERWEGWEETVGRIGFIQEPGYKLRSIANPVPAIQWCLSRIGRQAYDMLSKVKDDCTFDQQKGIQDSIDYLKRNKRWKLAGLDLSSATDRFPWSFTRQVLEHLGFSPVDLDFFEKVSRGKWLLPRSVERHGLKTISWSSGQPLGTYPSFAMFALSHHWLVRQIVGERGFYRILGDDIIIEEEYAEKLRDLYLRLGVKVSVEKTLTSDKLVEFGGRLITPAGAYSQPKWREPSDRNFIDLARQLGERSLPMFRFQQREILKIFGYMPLGTTPYSLGWNSQGIPYDIRVQKNRKVIEALSASDDETRVVELPDATELRQLKESILTGRAVTSQYALPTTHGISQGSFESDLLDLSGIIRYDTDRLMLDPQERASSIQGDPRGRSVLDLLRSVVTKARKQTK